MPKLLLVEDNEENRDMLSRRLFRKGYDVAIAVDGAEGVAKALSEQPDLVLMDIDLPVIDGYEATRQIKANPLTGRLPILALTADVTEGVREQALAAGCDEFETKPIDLPRLLEKIEALIAAAQPAQSDSLPQAIPLPADSRIQQALFSYLRHELCTPMNAIIGYSEMLLDELKGQSDSAQISDLEIIHTCGTQLLSLANVIFDPAKVELSPLNRDIKSFGASVRLEMLTPLSTIIGYCEMLLEESSAAVMPDVDRIYRAAQQLLGMVNDIVELSRQQLQILNTGGADSGSDPFSLLLDSTTATSLLQQAATTMRALEGTPLTEPDSQGGHILVVDDNETNRDLLSRQLEDQRYTISQACHGREALQILQTQPCDLILLDLIMPEMNGFEVLERLKQSEALQSIPVIMMSSLNEMDSVVRCVEMGAEDYLTKPFKPVLLRAKIAAHLEKKRLRDQRVMHLAQHLIAEATPVPVLIWRLSDGAILYGNATAGATFGCPNQTLLNHRIQDFFASAAEYASLTETLSHNQPIQHHEIQCQRADGMPFWVTASLKPLMGQGEATVLGALVDITARKQAEDSLRLAEEKYRSIFENALEGIFQSSPDGYYLSVNPAMARIHGYDSPAEMMAEVKEIGHQIYVDPAARQQFIGQVEAEGRVTGYEYQAYRKDGDMMWLSESVRAVRNGKGELLYYEGIVEDVTERKLAEAALQRQVVELKIEIDQVKLAREVSAITQSDYFQQLQAEAEKLRMNEKGWSKAELSESDSPAAVAVLLVEDNEMNRDMLSRRLQRLGYQVLIAGDGMEGVAMAVSHRPDIVLMDMSLPVMDGWEATQQLKANPQTANIPVIALTAHAMAGDREKALAIGCDDYDTKPIELPRLLSKITALLEKA